MELGDGSTAMMRDGLENTIRSVELSPQEMIDTRMKVPHENLGEPPLSLANHLPLKNIIQAQFTKEN